MSVLEKNYRILSKYALFFTSVAFLMVIGVSEDSYAEEFTVNIPFGAYNPELNTPAEVWYDPPSIHVNVGDTITWINDDQEGHTVTSGKSPGRMGFLNQEQGSFGKPDGIFDSGRFLPDDSWTYTFEKAGTFPYFCTIHPWMEGIVNVEQTIPDYPVDGKGNKIEKFPLIQFTPDKLVEFDLTWEPNVIKTFEKTKFIFQTYDGLSQINLEKMNYEMIISQNGRELFRDTGVTQVGGDYRNFIFETAGPTEIRFQNIVGTGTSARATIAGEDVENPIFRTVVFYTIVYDNPEKTNTTEKVIQPAKRIDLYYVIQISVIGVPAAMLVGIVMYMKFRKSKNSSQKTPSTPI